MNPAKAVIASGFVTIMCGAALSPVYFFAPGYPAMLWLLFTLALAFAVISMGPDLLPKRLRRLLLTWLS